MGSTDYLNSAKRATIAFFILAAVGLSAASYRLAVTAWGPATVAIGAEQKPEYGSRRLVRPACGERFAPRCGSVEIALGTENTTR